MSQNKNNNFNSPKLRVPTKVPISDDRLWEFKQEALEAYKTNNTALKYRMLRLRNKDDTALNNKLSQKNEANRKRS